jgi:hypothetical protein
MRTIVLLAIIFALWDCGSKKDDQGVNMGIRDNNGDTLSFSYFDPENGDYEFYDSDRADSIFIDKKNLSNMPGRFYFGIKNKKGKPYRYLMFKADSVLTLGKNYLDANPILGDEYSLKNYDMRVVDIRYDRTDTVVRENQLLVAIDKTSKDTILFQENIYFIKGKNVLGGNIVVFDNWSTQEEMREICENALKHAWNSMRKKPK